MHGRAYSTWATLCDDHRVGAPAWYRKIPQPLRWAVGGALAFALVGGAYGLAESIRDYPLSSWFGVTLYLLLLGTLGGFVLGVVAGALSIAAKAVFRRS
jgi:hypothetical protein